MLIYQKQSKYYLGILDYPTSIDKPKINYMRKFMCNLTSFIEKWSAYYFIKSKYVPAYRSIGQAAPLPHSGDNFFAP